MTARTASHRDIGAALFGRTRRNVLALLFGRPEQSFYLREIVKHAGTGTSQVQKELAQLSAAGLIVREERANQVYFQANPDAPVFAELKTLVAKTVGIADALREALRPFAKRIALAFVFGSVAKGEATAASDVDLLVVGDVALSDLADALWEAEQRVGRTISPTIYSGAEFNERATAGQHFLSTVLAAPKIFLLGGDDDLARLVQPQPRTARPKRAPAPRASRR